MRYGAAAANLTSMYITVLHCTNVVNVQVAYLKWRACTECASLLLVFTKVGAVTVL